jgi:hypothetical protein
VDSKSRAECVISLANQVDLIGCFPSCWFEELLICSCSLVGLSSESLQFESHIFDLAARQG